MIKTRYDEAYKKMNRKERHEFLKNHFNACMNGKYYVETKNSICNAWGNLMYRFNRVEDAVRFINFYCVPNSYGTLEPGRVTHVEFIDEATAKMVVDWEQEVMQ